MRALLIAAIAIVLATGGWWYFAGMGSDMGTDSANMTTNLAEATDQPATTPSGQTVDEGEVAPTEQPTAEIGVVTYGDSGFSPSNLTISAGQTVKFINNSSGLMHVASNPHPTHTDFSALDSQRGFAKGQSYSFTFDKPGTYGYHNHLNDPNDGTITVK